MEKEVPIKGQQNKKERKWIFIVDLSFFTNLREIDLCSNNLTSSVPSWLTNLTIRQLPASLSKPITTPFLPL
ncbi:hypothetical protein F8M41_012727 [Gigaspora margarita]|uniref:Uncharacterized protein n=1 Tax=Gigaspora margarita TaxID=4874 RepID=A0A8H3WZK4_GIGMA|nr:hypothetical protein F8M41_012727 [Gigaspora margarita]